MNVELADGRRVVGPDAGESTDMTAKVVLTGLAPGTVHPYRVRFAELQEPGRLGEAVSGSFRTAPATRSDVRFQWSADVAGQGWGINPGWGGYRIFHVMREQRPDFFIHCGDTIYADNPIPEGIRMDEGTVWRNLVAEGVEKVSETLDELRGRHRYNLLDEHLLAFRAAVPQIAMWDDHETLNNWYPGEVIDDPRYRERRVDIIAERARQAFLEYHPIAPSADGPARIHRSVPYGPSLEVFALDMRSYRGANSSNRQMIPGPDTAFMGTGQLAWLASALRESKATWKVVAADMPIGLIVRDGRGAFENLANGDGPPLGRELEVAALLQGLKRDGVRNVVFLTADVHYTAAHHYAPERARFKDFDPFWEFVSGPLNAGTFGPEELDDTFGPKVVFQKAPAPGQANLSPSAGLQFFGEVRIDGATEAMTVTLRDLTGAALWSTVLQPGS